ncbi:hypothetical protein BH20ACI1_BH20ACI1_07040 [soil metagenome]
MKISQKLSEKIQKIINEFVTDSNSFFLHWYYY